MECKIKINMNNAAFDNPGELSHILTNLAERYEEVYNGDESHVNYIFDRNGNKVGSIMISKENEY